MATQSTFSQAASSQVTEAFFNGIGDSGAALAQMEKCVKIDRDDVASLRKAAMGGITALQAWDGVSDPASATLATVDATHSQTVTYSTYMLNVRLPSMDVRDVPGIVQESAQKLGFAVSNTVVTQGFTQAAGVYGTDAADGSPPIAGPTGHALRSGNFANKITTALAADSLAAAIANLRAFQDHEGTIFDAVSGAGGLALVVPPALEKTAKDLVSPAYAGDLLSSNYFYGYGISVVVNPHQSDENDWFLTPTQSTPIRLWLRSSPDISVYTDPATRTLNIQAVMASASYFSPPGWQVITGAAVTGG